MRKFLIEEEGNAAVGCVNGLLVMCVAGLLVLAAIIGWRWYFAPAPQPEDSEELVFIPPMTNPVTGRAEELSWQLRGEEPYCLVLLPPEVSEEPDYEVRSGEECENN